MPTKEHRGRIRKPVSITIFCKVWQIQHACTTPSRSKRMHSPFKNFRKIVAQAWNLPFLPFALVQVKGQELTCSGLPTYILKSIFFFRIQNMEEHELPKEFSSYFIILFLIKIIISQHNMFLLFFSAQLFVLSEVLFMTSGVNQTLNFYFNIFLITNIPPPQERRSWCVYSAAWCPVWPLTPPSPPLTPLTSSWS